MATRRGLQAITAFSLLLFPAMFMSTAFVPEVLMPGWMQEMNQWNPVSYLIEAMRALMVTSYDWSAIGKALLALGVLGFALQIITIWAFRRLAH